MSLAVHALPVLVLGKGEEEEHKCKNEEENIAPPPVYSAGYCWK